MLQVLRVSRHLLILLNYIVVNSVNRKEVSFLQEVVMLMRLGYLMDKSIIKHLLLFMIYLGKSIQLILPILAILLNVKLSLPLGEEMDLLGYLS